MQKYISFRTIRWCIGNKLKTRKTDAIACLVVIGHYFQLRHQYVFGYQQNAAMENFFKYLKLTKSQKHFLQIIYIFYFKNSFKNGQSSKTITVIMEIFL